MNVGVVLPTFRDRFSDAKEALSRVEEAGIDGAFVFDHLWPMRHREQPAISAYPALGALSAYATAATLGTLVARVGVVDPEVLVREIVSASVMNGNRFIAGVGTADRKGEEEYRGYGLAFPDAETRRGELATVVDGLMAAGIPVWVGGGAPATNALCRSLGATLNLWGVTPDRIHAESLIGPVSWAGNLPSDRPAARALIHELAEAGATWSVFYWPQTEAGYEVLRDHVIERAPRVREQVPGRPPHNHTVR